MFVSFSQPHSNTMQPSLDFNMNFEEGALGDFDFDSFLQQPGDDGAFGNLTQDFDFHNVAEVEGGL